MKHFFRIVAVFAVVALTISAARCEDVRTQQGTDEVPVGNWIYQALPVIYPPLLAIKKDEPYSRYEIAILIARSLQKRTEEESRAHFTDEATVLEWKDARAALLREYSVELKELGTRVEGIGGNAGRGNSLVLPR